MASMWGIPSRSTPQPQVAVAAVDLIPGNPAEGNSRFHRPFKHQLRQLRLGPECHFLRYPGLPSPLPVLCPHLRQVQFAVQQRPAIGRGISQEYANLTVLDPARRAAVLTLHPNRLVPLLQESGLVYHQNCVSVGQMPDHVVFQVISNQVRVPPIVVQQALWHARLLRQLPTVLALHRTEQPSQICTTARGTPEPWRDALEPARCPRPTGPLPPLHMRCHRHTSTPLECLNSTCF